MFLFILGTTKLIIELVLIHYKNLFAKIISNNKVDTNRTESNLSKRPPWPGRRVPVSFRPLFLFRNEIKMSPKKATIVTKNENNIIGKNDCKYITKGNVFIPGRTSKLKIVTLMNPPNNPSQLLPGLIVGQTLCLPISFPKI